MRFHAKNESQKKKEVHHGKSIPDGRLAFRPEKIR